MGRSIRRCWIRGRMNSYPAEPATWGVTFRKNWD